MSGSAMQWSPPSTIGSAPASSTSPDRPLDRRVACAAGSAGSTGASPKSTTRSSSKRVDAGLQVRPGRAARGADRPRAEARARPVGDEIVRRRADDRHVDAGQLGGVLGVGQPEKREQPGVVGLLAELAPALERIDHRQPVFPSRSTAC